MTDLDQFLGRGERMRRTAMVHPAGLVRALGKRVLQLAGLWLFAWTAQFTLGALNDKVAAIVAEVEPLQDLGVLELISPLPALVGWACSWLVLPVVVLAALDVARWRTTRFVLTDQRVLQRYGVLETLVLDTPLDTICDTALSQSLLGERLDYGVLLLRTAAADGNQPLEYIAGPVAFKQAVERARQGRTVTERADKLSA